MKGRFYKFLFWGFRALGLWSLGSLQFQARGLGKRPSHLLGLPGVSTC